MSNILKKVCSAQELHCAEYADSMERCNMEERNRQYRSLKIQAAGAWLLAVPLLLLSIFRSYVPYGSEIQMLLAATALVFWELLSIRTLGDSFVQDVPQWIRLLFSVLLWLSFQRVQHFLSGLLVRCGTSTARLLRSGRFDRCCGTDRKIFHLLPEELHDENRIANIIFPF